MKFRSWILKLKRAWLASQVNHRGKYSIERLLALEEYTRTTPLLRAVLVCAGTPLPIIVIVFSQEALPLEDPENGWQVNWGLWVRACILSGTVSLAVAVQLRYLIQGLEMSSLQLIVLSALMALGFTAASITVASAWVFPIPYMVIVMIPTFLLLFVCIIRVLLGAATFRNILTKRRQFIRFVVAVNIQVLMAISYPAYQLLFNSVTGSAYELSAFLLLPVLKLVLKNLVALCLADLADLIPENIIFTVHFFNAIYLATSMQSASSTFAVSAIMIIDLLETGMTLYRIYRSSNRIMKQLQQTIGPSIAEDNLLAAAYSLCHYHDKFTKEERTQVQVRSFFPHQLSTEGHDLLRKLENGTGPTFLLRRTPSRCRR
ncbi:hypothetical protein JG688_00005678 [Phytophthora aleatoria]|uniref:Uncharacterized protein n=1 Tax=Phytophthora aleatoria TaxID=2496075 RepID=A0A8J5IZG9_9STRA|nr:hypothetical protein JG688_00005678 [Phytophthora aleatoria]